MLLAVKEIWNPETCACFTTENAAVIIAGSKIGMEIGMFQTDRRVDRDFYIMGWCAAGIFAALFLFVRVTGIPVWKFLLPCPFHALTGAYCPGCGGTRAVVLLHEGGHALIALLCGARITEFNVLGAYMRYEGGTFSQAGLSLFHIGSMLLPLLVSVVYMLTYRSKTTSIFYRIFSFISLIFPIGAVLAWVIVP